VKFVLPDDAPKGPEIDAWLEKISAFLPSDEDRMASLADSAAYGSSMLKWEGDKLVHVPRKDWQRDA
jgi:hypothetical protein